MSGKALLIVVLGFTIIFMIMGYFWGGIATRSTENHVSYYSTTVAHNIAVSGANIGLQKVIYSYNTTGNLLDGNIITQDFERGEMVVDIDTSKPVKVLTSKGYFPKGSTEPQIVKVKLLQDITSMARYAWFIPSVSTGASNQRPWITGNKIWGGFHSNQFLNVYGDPIFYGKVTTLKGIKDWGEESDPKFYGGYEEGISVSWEMNKKLDVQKAAAIEGQATPGAMCYFDKVGGKKVNNLWLQFNDDGTVIYRTDTNNSGDNIDNYSAAVTMNLSEMAPNGIIYVDNGDVYMSGTLNGKVTVVADGASGFGGPGNVYLVGDD